MRHYLRYPDDPPAFVAVNAQSTAPLLLIADHAGRAVPRSLDRLGLPDAAFERHVAYDIGIEAFARYMAEDLDAPLILHGHSRLVIDPNRDLDDPTSIAAISDGLIVSANRDVTAAEAEARAAALFHPYHEAIAGMLDRLMETGPPPALVSLHSFTPALRTGASRPWQVGILWNEDGRIPVPLMRRLAEDGIAVGDNQPYTGRNAHGYTVRRHAEARGLPHVLIEMRQDLIAAPADAHLWANRIAGALAAILETPT
jgi:predicted N-formylglutamate amidohydrolase